MSRTRLFTVVAALFCAVTSSACATAGPTVVLVRHAEKADDGEDPPLTTAGRARAASLVRLLERTGVDAIYTSEYARTRSTVEPLAAATGLTAEIVPAREPEQLLEKLRSHAPDDVVVVAGHSNTLPAIMEMMGATEPPAIEHHEYDRIFLVTLRPGGPPSVVELAFGERSVENDASVHPPITEPSSVEPIPAVDPAGTPQATDDDEALAPEPASENAPGTVVDG